MDAQDPMSTVKGLEAFPGRGAGTDAERRAANWLAKRSSTPGADVIVETFWCRPNWALAHLWHAAFAVAGSLLSLASPITGIVVLGLTLASIGSDSLTGTSVGRWLTPQRASQNIVVVPRGRTDVGHSRSRLVLAANYDAGRIGLAYRRPLRSTTALLTHWLRGATPGWLGWLSLAIIWLLGIAVVRQTGHTSHLVGAIQFPPTVFLVVGFALLLELATGQWSPAAGDNASGVAVALAVATQLAAAPPGHLDLELVLTGAGDGDQIGLRRYLRSQRAKRTDPPTRRRRLSPVRTLRGRRTSDTIFVGIAACGDGRPYWWLSDGALLPLRYSRQLRRIAARIAGDEPHLGVGSHRGRANQGAFAARSAGSPAITVGCLDDRGVAPRSHQKSDQMPAIDPQALDRAVQFALLVVDGIDAAVGEGQGQRSPAPA